MTFSPKATSKYFSISLMVETQCSREASLSSGVIHIHHHTLDMNPDKLRGPILAFVTMFLFALLEAYPDTDS